MNHLEIEGGPRKKRKLSHVASPFRTTSPLQGGLCDRCSAVDFTKVFDTVQLTKNGKPVLALDDLANGPTNNPCPVCQLLFSVSHKADNFRKYHLRVFDGIRILGARRSPRAVSNKVLAVVPGPMTRNFQNITSRSIVQNGIISRLGEDETSRDSVMYCGKLVSPASIAYDEIRQWLDECLWSHKKCRTQQSASVPGLKLIDCHTRQIVPMKPGDSYFALSYVWGPRQTSLQSLSEKAKNHLLLSGEIPKSISDALTVVEQLGHRFLWVDQFCIDDVNKTMQIRCMDRIYENSLATLIAAEGNDADTGLAGVSCPRLVQQYQIETESFSLLSTPPELSSTLQGSTWRSRAWTYQEAMLSKRCLFFTNSQVYFVCKTTTYCEAVKQTSVTDFISTTEKAGQALGPTIFRSDSATASKKTTSGFFGQLKEYSTRKLTRESDALDAFKGMLARTPFRSYWGIPLFFNQTKSPNRRSSALRKRDAQLKRLQECGFALGLLWICPASNRLIAALPESSRDREASCPTWSWASLRAHARYLGTEPMQDQDTHTDLLPDGPTFEIETCGGERKHLSNLVDEYSEERGRIIPELSLWLHVTSMHRQIYLAKKIKHTETANEMAASHDVFDGRLDSEDVRIGSAWLDRDILDRPDYRIKNRSWNAIQIHSEIYKRSMLSTLQEPRWWFMLLDQCEGGFRRVGLMRTWQDIDPSKRDVKTFRIR